jgi:hypothetical protein
MTSKEKEKNIEEPTPAAMMQMQVVKAGRGRLGFFKGWVIWYHIGDWAYALILPIVDKRQR